MQHLGIQVDYRNKPELDPGFIPIGLWEEAYRKGAAEPLALALERDGGQVAVVKTHIHGDEAHHAADEYYLERLVKTLLWLKGGFRVSVCGSQTMYDYLRTAYADGGKRDFDFHFMADVYEHPFEVLHRAYEDCPEANEKSEPMGRHLDGCRIGFDAGGSDRKVSAVIDGETVFSEETVWLPKLQEDPDYHFNGILDSLRAAAAHMPRVDAIGVSSAGIYIKNRTMKASLFVKVPPEQFEAKVKDIYLRAAAAFGVPVVVCNDGDVTALAGAMSLERGRVLGIAMGTSEAAGYVDAAGNITGWLNELAFVPVDANPGALRDEWSGDLGCGCKYFSQDAVIKLAPAAGIDLSAQETPAEKLKEVQRLMQEGDGRAAAVYRSLGAYLAHTLAQYAKLYDVGDVLLLGRVMSGRGGDLILSETKRILAEEYPSVKLSPVLPDEKFRRVGQSMAAASLPKLEK